MELKDLLTDLKSKKLLETEPAAVIEQCFDGNILEVVKGELCNSTKKPQGRRYSSSVKQFAVTLQYYSPQAYEYCRKIFSLPHPASIRNWLSNIDCDPGFLSNVLDFCGKAEGKDFSLVIDSMSLMKGTSYSNGNFTGFCDYGGLVGEGTEKLCTEALVFLLVPLQFSKTQYPIGYFLVDKVNSQIQLELVNTVLHLTAERGIKVRNITCDGASANQTMFSLLGCQLNPVDPKPYFKHPVQSHNVYATLDICHMLKLARNALADAGSFLLPDDDKVCWQYFADLCALQDKIGLHLANKLSTQHVDWRKQKMKVKLAAQTFSRSVSDALQYLKDTETEGFRSCAATIEFTRQVLCVNCENMLAVPHSDFSVLCDTLLDLPIMNCYFCCIIYTVNTCAGQIPFPPPRGDWWATFTTLDI